MEAAIRSVVTAAMDLTLIHGKTIAAVTVEEACPLSTFLTVITNLNVLGTQLE
jgi:hypothetical protein